MEYSFGLLTYPIWFMFYLFSLSENTKENNLLGSRNNINKVLDGKSETDIKNYIEQFFVGLLE
ncbi:hypothetical protein ACRS2D_00215, partial [Riemerella anatipestifer]